MNSLRQKNLLKQQGSVLVVSLIMLLILTLLGISALHTTSMEEKMATNTQSINRAFQAAEAGIDVAFANPDSFDLTTEVSNKTAVLTGNDYSAGGANTLVRFLRATNPPVGSLYSSDKFSAYHFDLQSVAGNSVTDSGGSSLDPDDNSAIVRLHGGAFQIGPKL